MEHDRPFEMRPYTGSSQHPLAKNPYVSAVPVNEEYGNEEPPTWKENMKSSMDRFWILEVTSLFVSLCALMGIVGLLRAYDNKPLPQWKSSGSIHLRNHIIHHYSLSITLNSLLSLIATVYKIALGIPVAASLGQLKWVWFSEGQRLADFQMFDSAKGVLGSLMLLWNLRAR